MYLILSWSRGSRAREVVAYARDPSKLGINNEHLTVIEGELTDEHLIESVVTGANAVISALGPRGSSKNKRACKVWAHGG
jgi:putative NADH-flavin reductase